MLKRFNKLALIVLLVFQTMIAPVAATAQGIVEQEGSETRGAVDSPGEEGAIVDPEDTGNEDPDADEEEPAEENVFAKPAMITLQARDLGNIFTVISLKINDEDITNGDVIVIENGTRAQLGFEWDTDGLSAKAGDTASVRLSDAFEEVTTPMQEIEVDGTVVGTYNVEAGILKFVFDDRIENDDVQNGYVNLGLEFNLDKFKENIKQQIPFNDGNENNITVTARPNTDPSGINKEGQPDSQHDAREITWTIDVINTNDEEITGATLADDIPDGLGVARDFVIHELSVGFGGDIREGANVTSTLKPSEFPIELGAIAPFNGYRIQYKTTIENYATESFTNDATFEYGEESLPANGIVSGLTRSNPIEKKGWQVGDDDVIQWQIDVNKNGSLISKAIVKDELPDGLTIAPGSIEVVRITQTGGNWGEGDAHEESFLEFPIELGELGQEDAYRIKFKTDVDWSEVNEGEYLENNSFNNVAILYDDEDELNKDNEPVPIVRDPILEKEGKSNVDYDNKTVTWTIHVNEAGHPIGNVELTDLIPEGLAIYPDVDITDEEGKDYIPNSISIDPDAEGGTEVVINLGDVGTRQLKVEYTTAITDFTIDNFNNGVGMTGAGIGLDGEYDNDNIPPEGNTYGKSFKGIDYNEKTMDWQLTVNPRREAIASLTIEDTFPNKGMILLPGTVDVWFLGSKLIEGTDYTLVPRTEDEETGYHKGFIITLDNALSLDNDQLVVDYQTSYDPEQAVDGNTLDPYEPIVGDDDNNTDRLYVNRAHYTGTTVNNNNINQTRDASQRVREDSWNSGKKEGQLVHFDDEDNVVNGWGSGTERKIAWQLYTNYQQQNLGTGVVVTDTLDYAGIIDKESIQVSVYEVDSDGETTITDTTLNSENYSVNPDEEGKFTLTFKDNFEVTERYVIEFTTSVPDISEANYTNNAIVTVGGIDYDYSATLNYNEYDNFLDKRAVNAAGNRAFTGDEVEWEVKVNESLSIIEEAVITDTISAGHVYLEGSLEIYKSQDRENALEEGADLDYTLEVGQVTDGDGEPTGETNLVIDITEDLQDTLVLEYTTIVTETDGEIGNRISIEGATVDQQSKDSPIITARQFSSVGGEWATNRGALRITKVDSEANELIANNEATFTLWFDLNGERVQYIQVDGGNNVIPFTTEGGVLEIGNLPIRTYYLTEVESPEGYVLSENAVEITVEPFGDNENYFEVDFKNTKEKTDVTGTKVWVGGESVRESIELQLLRDGEDFGDAVPLENGKTEYTWKNLDRTDINGTAYEYTVDEVDVPEHFTQSISSDGLTITNTYEIPTTEVTATKEWTAGPEERPTVWFELYREIDGGEKERVPDAEIKTLENGTIEVKWTGIEATDRAGDEYTFSVQEVDADGNDFTPENYAKAENGLEVTNTYVSPTDASATAVKEWVNGPTERPTVWFELYRQVNDGELQAVPGAEIKELPNGTTEVVWTGLTKTDATGNEYTFSVKEVDKEGNDFTPENYEKSISEDGRTITNTYVIPTQDIPATKVWVDGPADRPTVWFELYRQIDGGEKEQVPDVEIQTLENGTTEVVWTDLETTDISGNKYTFSVQEADEEGNDFTPENYEKAENGLEVTNAYVSPADASAKAVKEWVNGSAERPTVWFELYRQVNDGELQAVPEAEIKELVNGITEVVWTGLTKTDATGKDYTFSVKEVDKEGNDFTPENYKNSISEDGRTITNTYVIPTKNIPATKVWVDGPEERPTVWFELYRQIENEEKEKVPGTEIKVLENGTTEVEWTNIEATDSAGNEYTFSVKEVDEEGNDFTPENYGKVENGLEVTNTYVISKTEIPATKEWIDGPEERPTVWFELYRQIGNEEKERVPEADIKELESGITEIEWTEIEATDIAGNEYTFSVQEVDEEGNDFTPESYEKAENGLKVTNTYVSPTDASAKAVKEWVNGSSDRPTVWFKLYRQINEDELQAVPEADIKELPNGVTEVVWTGLTKTDANGEEYTFSVQEVDEDGNDFTPENYEKSEEGLTITNAYVVSTTVVTGNKEWVGGPEDKPAIEIQLYRNGEVYGEPVTLENGETEYTWIDLDKTDVDGNVYEYTVDEVNVPESYEKAISEDGQTVINTYVELEDSKLGGESGDKDPEDPTDLDDVGGDGDGDAGDGEGKRTPSTATNIYNLTLIGFGLMLLGLILFLVRRKRIE